MVLWLSKFGKWQETGLSVGVNTQSSWLVNTWFSSVISASTMHNTDSRFIILCACVCFWQCLLIRPNLVFKNTCPYVCGCVSSCLLSCRPTSLAHIYLWECVFVCVHVCMCLCVLLVKDLHRSVSPPSVKSRLVPVCLVSKTRHNHTTPLLYCTHCSPAVYLCDATYRPCLNSENKARIQLQKSPQIQTVGLETFI